MASILSRPQCVNLAGACLVYMQHPNLLIIAPADVLTPDDAKPSTSTMRTELIDIFSFNSLRLSDAYASLNWVIIGSCNGLLPIRCQAITSDELLSIGHRGAKFIQFFMEIKTFSLMKLYLNMLSAKVEAILSDLKVSVVIIDSELLLCTRCLHFKVAEEISCCIRS